MRNRTLIMGAVALIVGASLGYAQHAAAGSASPVQRDPVLRDAETIDAFGTSVNPLLYGGVAVDERSGTVRVLLTQVTASAEALFSAQLLDASRLRFEYSPYSWTALTSAQQRLEAAEPTLAAEGVHVTSVGLGVGRVKVTIAETTPASVALIQHAYGAIVEVTGGVKYTTSATATRYDPPPYLGGMEIDDLGNAGSITSNNYYKCTAGYIGYRTINGLPYYQLITAGHCFGEPEVVYHELENAAPVTIGQVNANWYYSGSNADTESIDIRSGWGSASSSVITAEPDVHNVDFLDGTQINGVSVCKSGITTDQTCNFAVNATHEQVTLTDDNGNQTVLNDQVGACCDVLDHGDSGGPVYHYYQPQNIEAEGTLVGGEIDQNGNFTGQMVYSFIQNIINDLGVVVCTRAPGPTGC